MFAFATDRLLGTLEDLAAGDGELKDFGHGLLPRLVEAGAAVERSVLDRGVRVGPGAVVGGQGGDGPALVAEEASVPRDATVAPGGRFSADDHQERSGRG